MFLSSFMQVMWRAHKHPIDVKGNDFILALNCNSLKGVRGALSLDDNL